MGDTEWETFNEAHVEWVPFAPSDPAPVEALLRSLLDGSAGSALVRVEGAELRPGRGLLGRRKRPPRLASQVVAGRHGAPIVLTIGEETDDAVGERFAKAGIVLPAGWSLAAPGGTFPWVEAPAGTDPRAVADFLVGAMTALGAGAGGGAWRAGLDTPRMIEHSHGPDGTHSHLPGEHHHH
jgi:hypothetical protein